MIASDPLSLVFIACTVFAGAFIIATTALGMGHGHGLHVGHVASHGAHSGGHHAGVAGHHAGATPTHATALPHSPTPGTRVALPHHAANAANSQSAQAAVASPLALRLLGALNINAVLTFLFFFGLLGYLLHNVGHAGAFVTILFAVVIGLGAAAVVNALLLRLFGTESGRLDPSSSELPGRIAQVSLAVRAGGIGEIIYVDESSSRHSLGARSSDGSAIARDADVVIVDFVNGIAVVQGWDDFLISAQRPGLEPTQIPT